MEFLADRCGESNRDGGFDYHYRIRIDLHHQFDNGFHRRGIEEILMWVIVCRGSNNHKFSIFVRSLTIKCSHKIQFFFCKILFYVFILDWGLSPIDHFHLFRYDIHRLDAVSLGEQGRHRKAYIACSCYCNFHFFIIKH